MPLNNIRVSDGIASNHGSQTSQSATEGGTWTSIRGGDRRSLSACRNATATWHMAVVTPGAHQIIRGGHKGSQPKAAGGREDQRDYPGGALPKQEPGWNHLTFSSAFTPTEPHPMKDSRPRTGINLS